MSENTKIEWATHTFNPWIGCTKVHEGCRFCYAEADMDIRRKRVAWGPAGTRSKTTEENWKKPLKWNRDAEGATDRPRVFCASLADVFEDWDGPIVDHKGVRLWTPRHGYVWDEPVPESAGYDFSGMRPLTMADMRESLFHLIDQTPNLDWLILTKRPENVRRMMPKVVHEVTRGGVREGELTRSRWPTVWLLTSISNQESAVKQIPEILKCRDLVPVLGVSAEPLLEAIDLRHVQHDGTVEIDSLTGDHGVTRPLAGKSDCKLDWVIIGGESGPHARPFNLDWARSLIRQCREAGVKPFLKQIGSKPIQTVGDGWTQVPIVDPKGGTEAEWPSDLQGCREFPGPVSVER